MHITRPVRSCCPLRGTNRSNGRKRAHRGLAIPRTTRSPPRSISGARPLMRTFKHQDYLPKANGYWAVEARTDDRKRPCSLNTPTGAERGARRTLLLERPVDQGLQGHPVHHTAGRRRDGTQSPLAATTTGSIRRSASCWWTSCAVTWRARARVDPLATYLVSAAVHAAAAGAAVRAAVQAVRSGPFGVGKHAGGWVRTRRVPGNAHRRWRPATSSSAAAARTTATSPRSA